MINLSQYFQRIAFTGEAKHDLATLNALTFAHSTHIPFEKLVLRKRGGYCFEQNGLFLEVLKQIGFHVEPPTAKSPTGTPAPAQTPTLPTI